MGVCCNFLGKIFWSSLNTLGQINGWKLSGNVHPLGEGKSSDPDPIMASGSMLIFGGVDALHDQS